jgi:MoaA/NifB/PqqE/SkfB family radical SAM enzyme
MSLKTAISRVLDRFEGGRAFKARVGTALRENSARPGEAGVPWQIAHLERLDIEVCYLCNLECLMCPRMAEGHKEGLMPLARFARLAPALRHVRHTNLTGYGESMMNPHLPEMIALARGQGSTVALTTNGTLLNAEKSRALIQSGIGFLSVSIDGGTRETYERIRIGANWDRLLRNCETFCKVRDEMDVFVGTTWTFVVMRDNFRELPLAAQLAADLGFHKLNGNFIARNVGDYEHDQLLHTLDGTLLEDTRQEFEETVARTREVAERNGLQLFLAPYHYGEGNGCFHNPEHSLFVDWMGNVTPCCNLPVRNEFGSVSAHAFGNLDEQDLVEILATPRLRKYLQNWNERRIPGCCQGCHQTFRLPDRDTYTDAVE